jgi:hypothetical protein
VTLLNYDEIKMNLSTLKTNISNRFNQLFNDWTKDKIDKYIIDRENNISENQTKMINSILRRKPQRIIIDRVLYKNDQGEILFTNNPKKVEEITIKHFQTIGSQKHHHKIIKKIRLYLRFGKTFINQELSRLN